MAKNTYINTEHTREEIENYLKRFRQLVQKGKFYIPETKPKNKEFIEKYKLTTKKRRKMLLELEATDFCYSIKDDDNENEILYIFAKEYELDNWGNLESVLVYIKIVIKEGNYTVIISFHEPEKNIKKLFK